MRALWSSSSLPPKRSSLSILTHVFLGILLEAVVPLYSSPSTCPFWGRERTIRHRLQVSMELSLGESPTMVSARLGDGITGLRETSTVLFFFNSRLKPSRTMSTAADMTFDIIPKLQAMAPGIPILIKGVGECMGGGNFNIPRFIDR